MLEPALSGKKIAFAKQVMESNPKLTDFYWSKNGIDQCNMGDAYDLIGTIASLTQLWGVIADNPLLEELRYYKTIIFVITMQSSSFLPILCVTSVTRYLDGTVGSQLRPTLTI